MTDLLLRPGTRLMRRFGIAGKFTVIAVLLVLPLFTALTPGLLTIAQQLRVIEQERAGLVLADPMLDLVIQLGQPASVDAADPAMLDPLTAISDVSTEVAQVGPDLGVQEDWSRLRALALRNLGIDQGTGSGQGATGTARPGADQVTQAAIRLLDRIQIQAGYDREQDAVTHELSFAILDRLPSTMVSAARAARLAEQIPATGAERAPAVTRTGAELKRFSEQVLRLATLLADDVGEATWDTTDARITARARVLPQTRKFQAAADELTAAVTPSRGRADAVRIAAAQLRLSTSARAMQQAMVTGAEEVLQQRRSSLLLSLRAPLLLVLASLLGIGYLLFALYRATSQDVGVALADINTLTTGALNQSEPLTGRDEFAQMSRAIVLARDRLTSLLGTLRYQATHDKLTALGNRELFTEKLAEALEEPGARVGVLFVDLHGFKDVNDSFGHALGDRLMRSIGARFHRAPMLRRNLVARLGSAEFAVLLADAPGQQEVMATAHELRECLQQPVDLEGRRLRVRASIGLALGEQGLHTAAALIRNAYVAMHVAKESTENGLAVFEGSMHETVRDRTELSADLVQAVEHGQMSLLYQPIVDLATHSLHGVEALVRWEHPTRGAVPPDVFVPLAEATGLIGPLGRWVLRESVYQLAAWQAEFPHRRGLTMDVNLSPEQLRDPPLVEEILDLIGQTGIDPTALVLEITESALVRDVEKAMQRMSQLAAMGVGLALDDFGTGYSSLSYLRRLPVTVLKIDKSFVSPTDSAAGPGAASIDSTDPDRSASAMLRIIASLGTSLGMQIVAEGVETPDQVAVLRDAGCHLGQGYYWSRPLPAEQITEVLRRGGTMDPLLPRQRSGPGLLDGAGLA